GIEKKGVGKLKNLNLGIGLLNDVSGSNDFTTNQIQLGLANNFYLNSDSSLQLSIGILPEIIFQNVNLSGFADQYQNNQYSPNLPTSEPIVNQSGNGFNLSGGLHLVKQLKNKN